MTDAKRTAIIKAVERAKNSQFKATAIKVELEAQLQRNGDFYSTTFCHDFIMERLEKLGLAEHDHNDYIRLSHDVETHWFPLGPLTYAEFYCDGSVDSEFTFTLMIDKPENVFLIPKVIKIFKELAKAVGNGMDVRGAGMHMAFLNSPHGDYPSDTSSADENRFHNYRISMRMLLPALFFLAANKEISRGLGFRRPDVGRNSHRTAIDYRQGALEFRVFDTCYNKPEAILDNIVVMSNTMKYWKDKFVKTGVEKIATTVKFGRDGNDRLDRFFVTYTHLDLLNWGLERLKPSYLSISELKKQRKFTLDKRELTKQRNTQERAATAEYSEYEDRFDVSMFASRHSYMSDLAREIQYQMESGLRDTIDVAQVEAEIADKVEEWATNRKKARKSIKKYVADRLRQIESDAGDWTLTAPAEA